jgi:ribosomal protein S18 acetylase RimI-like enzyme
VLHSAEEHVAFFSAYVAGEGHWVEVAVVVAAEAAAGAAAAAAAGSDVVAFCGVHDGSIDHLYVVPAWQEQGIGGALLDRAMAAHSGGLSLWVFQENVRAQALYARAGFVEQFRTDGGGNEERVPDVRMSWSGSGSASASA